jgi:outer membrane protein W
VNRALLLALLALPSLAKADPKKPIYIRAGVVHLAPLEVSREMELADVDGPASLAVQNGPIAGSGATISSATIPGIIIGYVLPWWKDGRVSVETILGLPFTVKFKATGTLVTESLAPTALGIPTGVGPLGEMGDELGEAKAVPPVVTLVYRVGPLRRVQPYVGGGVAVMFAMDEKVTHPMRTAVSQPDMSVAPAPGLVLQGGVDAMITKRVYARLDVKFIAGMLARARVEHVQVRTPELPLFDTVEVGTAKMSMWVNPLIVQAGIGTDF